MVLALGSAAFTVLLVGAAEWGLRRADPDYFTRVRTNVVERLSVYSEHYGWEPRPGARVVERGALVTVNARGLRGRDVPLARGGRPRLVLLGDSMAFGHGVADEHIFAALLDADPQGFETVNLGVEGYGPDQALLRFEREGRVYAPDVVTLSLCVDNDFVDAGLPVFLYDGVHPKPWFELDGERLVLHAEHLRLGLGQRLGAWLAESSQLYNRAAALLPARASGAPESGEPWRARRDRVLSDPERAVERVVRIVLRLRDGVRDVAPGARPARLVVLLHPGKESYNQGSPLAADLAVRLRAAGVEVLDLAGAYRARGLRFSEFAFDPTGHPDAAGHAVIAAALLQHLRGAPSAGQMGRSDVAPGAAGR